MPAVNADLQTCADIVQEAITNLAAAADQLGQKQPSRHTDRMTTAVHLEVAQLESILPSLRDLTRDPREPRATPIIPASLDIDGRRLGSSGLPDRSPLLTGEPTPE